MLEELYAKAIAICNPDFSQDCRGWVAYQDSRLEAGNNRCLAKVVFNGSHPLRVSLSGLQMLFMQELNYNKDISIL